MEIVVSDEFARQLLTDDANFSFERGVAKVRTSSLETLLAIS